MLISDFVHKKLELSNLVVRQFAILTDTTSYSPLLKISIDILLKIWTSSRSTVILMSE